MRLLCFPHYTAGGLLCDIFERKVSKIGLNGGVDSVSHSLGKIGDSDTIFTDFDADELKSKLSVYKNVNVMVGTHCWPGNLDCSVAEEVISITTETSKSKIYRWLRSWHHHTSKLDNVKSLTGIDLIDKQRELAKNYLIPFRAVNGVTNIEFADIVEATPEFFNLVKDLPTNEHLKRWHETNQFLYDKNLWNNNLVQRYYEAEFEVAHGRYYQYH